MPGLHFYHDSEGTLGQKEDLLLDSVRSLLHEEWFKQKTLLSNKNSFLGATYHSTYPVTTFENDDFFICLEGKVYGEEPASLDASLASLATILVSGRPAPVDRVASWLLGVDGDFVIFVRHKPSGMIFIMNDALGRLPLYCHITGGRIFVSREPRFITSRISKISFDRMAIAQFLLLGFMPGGRTFFEGIRRLSPATLVTVEPPGGRIRVENLFRFEFSPGRSEKRTAGEYAEEMTSIFREACRVRAGSDGVNVLAMSGGLDSRSVAAALAAEKIEFHGSTFLDHFGTASADSVAAEEIASVLGVPWKLFPLGPAKGKDVLKLLRMKSGDNFLGMSFSVPLFEAIRSEWGGRINYFTGEGGGLTIPDNRPFRKLAGVDGLTDFLIARNSIFSLEQAAAATGIGRGDIRSSIREYLESCPEQYPDGKYLHFIVCERNLGWTSSGEDRNRFWFWTATPFNSLKLLDYAMKIPGSLKSHYNLYREFLMRLSPEAAAVNNVNWGMPISGRRYLLYLYARELYYRLPGWLGNAIKKRTKSSADLIGPYDRRSGLMSVFRAQFESCPAVGLYLSREKVPGMIPSLNKYAFDHIFTVSSLIEDVMTGRSTLSYCLDREMI